jgi:hypothetical protein
VNVSIVSEAQAQLIKNSNLCTQDIQSDELVNCVGNLEYNSVNNVFIAEFKNMQLKKIKRNGKTRDDKIVDEKFALLFQTSILVGPFTFNVWTLSSPVIVITNTNQQIDAMATIFWDSAFSDLHRVPFDEPKSVRWSLLAEALSMIFEYKTGRGLTPENLHFLCEKILRTSLPFPVPSDTSVTRAQFCKNLMLGSLSIDNNFSFWKWFYKELELVQEQLKDQWKDGLIIGFISKHNIDRNLINSPPGTFLLRFSERILGRRK